MATVENRRINIQGASALFLDFTRGISAYLTLFPQHVIAHNAASALRLLPFVTQCVCVLHKCAYVCVCTFMCV